jgi:hypothetical protein
MKLLLLILSLISAQFIVSQNSMLYFETNSFALTEQHTATLDALIVSLKKDQNLEEIAIIGQTDTDASVEFNMELSLNRARSVRDYLVSNEIFNRLHLLSKGEMSSADSTGDIEQKRLNRRVEIVTNYDPNAGKLAGLSPFSGFEMEPQKFTIDPRKNEVITAKGGAKFVIDRDIFKRVNWSIPLEVEIKEYYEKGDFIIANLTTRTTGDKLLESKGMVDIEVRQNGASLTLKEDASIGVLFPDRAIGDSTELFRSRALNTEILWDQITFNSMNDFKPEDGHTAWYDEGPYVKRARWKIEGTSEVMTKYVRTDIKGAITYDTVLVSPQERMEILVLPSVSMGLLNCDRFIPLDSTSNIFVEFDGDIMPQVCIVLDDLNAVIPYRFREDNKLIFMGVPENAKITFIGAYKPVNAENMYFSAQKSTSSDNLVVHLDFEQVNPEQLKEALSKL